MAIKIIYVCKSPYMIIDNMILNYLFKSPQYTLYIYVVCLNSNLNKELPEMHHISSNSIVINYFHKICFDFYENSLLLFS